MQQWHKEATDYADDDDKIKYVYYTHKHTKQTNIHILTHVHSSISVQVCVYYTCEQLYLFAWTYENCVHVYIIIIPEDIGLLSAILNLVR